MIGASRKSYLELEEDTCNPKTIFEEADKETIALANALKQGEDEFMEEIEKTEEKIGHDSPDGVINALRNNAEDYNKNGTLPSNSFANTSLTDPSK